MRISALMAAAALLSATTAEASETVTFAYDAQGRLVRVSHGGSVNNGQVSAYAYDKADNRTAVTVTGAAH